MLGPGPVTYLALVGASAPRSCEKIDPSVTLEEHPVKEIAEGPVDILASEEYLQPGRGSPAGCGQHVLLGVGVVITSCAGAPDGSSPDGP